MVLGIFVLEFAGEDAEKGKFLLIAHGYGLFNREVSSDSYGSV